MDGSSRNKVAVWSAMRNQTFAQRRGKFNNRTHRRALSLRAVLWSDYFSSPQSELPPDPEEVRLQYEPVGSRLKVRIPQRARHPRARFAGVAVQAAVREHHLTGATITPRKPALSIASLTRHSELA